MPDQPLNATALRVLIVDRHEVSRAAITALLRTEGLKVVADVATTDEGLALAGAATTDVAIVDIDPATVRAVITDGALARLAAGVVLTSSGPLPVDLSGYTFIPKSEICARRLRQALTTQHIESEDPIMSMKAYLDTIAIKTGRTPEEIIDLARDAGLLEPGFKPHAIVAWLGDEFGLGRGHAMAIVAVIRQQTEPRASTEDKIDRHFAGPKATWRPVYNNLVSTVSRFGSDTDIDPGKSYLSLRRAGKKFAIVQVTANRLDVGIRLKDEPPGARLEAAGTWNAMVTHRVRLHQPDRHGSPADRLARARLCRALITAPIPTHRLTKGRHPQCEGSDLR
jgi:CheY-like chemotaxis protein